MISTRPQGFTVIELLVVIAIISILATVALPQILGAREKARHAVCLESLVRLAPELINRLESFEATNAPNPAQQAIDEVIDRLTREEYANPRNLAEIGYAAAPPAYVPTVDTSCVVYLYDATSFSPLGAPTIVATHYEQRVRSFQIGLN